MLESLAMLQKQHNQNQAISANQNPKWYFFINKPILNKLSKKLTKLFESFWNFNETMKATSCTFQKLIANVVSLPLKKMIW